MRKLTKVLSVLLVLALVVTAFAACGKKDEGTTESKKTYIIYSDNSFAPFEYLDKESNKYIGIDMDILAAIAEDQGFEYEMHNEGFDASMGAVQSGQADAMIAGMTITEERKETFDFARDGCGIAFCGDADPWVGRETVAAGAKARHLPLTVYPGANHSLETGDVLHDLDTLKDAMRRTENYIQTL